MLAPAGFSYLSTPYSKYPDGLEQAFICACALAARLLQAGIVTYSPIAHMHPVAGYVRIDTLKHDISLPRDAAMMLAAERLIVAHMEGWQMSDGIAAETREFERMRKPIVDLDPVSLVLTERTWATV